MVLLALQPICHVVLCCLCCLECSALQCCICGAFLSGATVRSILADLCTCKLRDLGLMEVVCFNDRWAAWGIAVACCPASDGVWWFLGLGLWALVHAAFVAWTGSLEYPGTCSLCAQFVVATVAVMPRGFYCNTTSIAQVPPKHNKWTESLLTVVVSLERRNDGWHACM